MGEGADRVQLVQGINQAFDAANIRETARRASEFADRGDFLEICHSLGLLAPVAADLQVYRRELTMPPLSREIMTVAFRASLFGRPGPTPLHLTIHNGEAEAINVGVRPDLISIRLTRTAPAVR